MRITKVKIKNNRSFDNSENFYWEKIISDKIIKV